MSNAARPKCALQGFSIAGQDHKFVWAEAKIAGNDTVVVSSPKVAKPVAARLRTDDFPMTTKPKPAQ